MAVLQSGTTIGGHAAIHTGNVADYAGMSMSTADGRYQLASTAINTGNIGSQSVSYAATAGRAYPRRSDGTNINFYWSGQSGQPTWLWGSNNGEDFYVWNPSNFSVSYASSAGNADTVDGYHESAFWRNDQNRVIGVLRFTGEGGDSGNGNIATSYGIYQQGGAWTYPYPDLCIGFHTGIKIGAHYSYGGTRFYNNSDWVTEIFSVGNGDNHVRVENNLYVGNTIYNNGNAVIHAGNIGSQSVNYATSAGNVAWTGVTAGRRTNYDLGFEAPSAGYAGFSFTTPGGAAENAGYFLIRGGADNDVYTQNGITLVADAGWLSLAQRTTAGKGVRIMSGTTSTTRMSFNADGTTYLYTDLYLGSTNTRITATDASGYVRLYGSAGNYLALGPYNNNGWVYFENSGNANGIYFNSPGRYAFDNGDVTPYNDAENSLGNGSYRWSQVYTSGWLRQYGAQGMYNQDYGTHFYSNAGNAWSITGSGGNVELQFRSNHQSTLRGWVYATTSNEIGFLSEDGNWVLRTWNRGVEAYGSMRAPIFYDSNDTGYYGNFAGFSRLSEAGITNTYTYNYFNVESSRAVDEFGHVGLFRSTQSGANNYIPFSFQSQYGNHSWGQVARFHIEQSGADRPSIQFSSGTNNTRWNIGYCSGSDDNFRITQNMGFRPDMSGVHDSWGTERFKINTDGNIYVDGLLQSASSLRAPIFYDSNDTSYYLDPNSTSRIASLQVNRHIDAVTGWGNASNVLFLNWDGRKVVLGNNNNGWHDLASALGQDQIITTNRHWFPQGIQPLNMGGAVLNLVTSNIGNASGNREAVTFIDGSQVQAHVSVGSGSGGNCYQWYNTEWLIVDPEKDYEFSVWVKSSGHHNIYLGWHEQNDSWNQITSNPYFHTGSYNTQGGWIKIVAKLRNWRTSSPQGNDSADRWASTNSKTSYANDGVMHSSTRYVHLRMGTCYGDGSANKTYFHLASVREITGHDQYAQSIAMPYFNGSQTAGTMYLRSQTHWDNYSGIDIIGASGEFRISSDSGAMSLRVDGSLIASDNVYLGARGVYLSDWLNQSVTTGASPTFAEVYNNGWFRTTGHQGLYNPTNGAHFYPNDYSYGSWRITGSRNGWTGLHFGGANGITLMMNEGEFGFHREGVGWVGRFTSGYFDGTAAAANSVAWGNVTGKPSTFTAGGGNSDTVAGLAVHGGRNNEANKVVRTDGNGYIQAGWINSDSGNMGFGNRIARIQCSDDNYIRFQTLSEFKVSLGLSGKNDYSRRIDYTSDSNYHVGSFGHGGSTAGDPERIFHYGSGFFDIWSGAGTYPPGTSHVHGINMLHYSTGYGGNGYGWQMASQYNQTGLIYARWCSGGTFSDWQTIITSTNIGSQSVNYATSAGSAASASSVAWGNVSGRPTALSQFTNDSGYITGSGRAYPRRNDGNDMNFYWDGQGGQPTWLWGSNDGREMYVWNPSNFSVNYANSAGSAPANGGTATNLNGGWISSTTGGIDELYANNVYANVYYRKNNTGWYMNPGSLSNMNIIYVDRIDNYGWLTNSNWNTAGMFYVGEAGDTGAYPIQCNATRWDVSIYAPNGPVYARGFVDVSDLRKKTNIADIQNPLQTVLDLRGVTYNWLNSTDSRTHSGLIAQEVEVVLPHVVTTTIDPDTLAETKGVNYSELIPYLVESIKAQQALIQDLQARLANLENN